MIRAIVFLSFLFLSPALFAGEGEDTGKNFINHYGTREDLKNNLLDPFSSGNLQTPDGKSYKISPTNMPKTSGDPDKSYNVIKNSLAWKKDKMDSTTKTCTMTRNIAVKQKETLCSDPLPDGYLGSNTHTTYYKVRYFYNWERNDCNCYRTPGINPSYCPSPAGSNVSSPPDGAKLYGRGATYHARKEKEGWDVCLTSKYKLYKLCKRYSDVLNESISDACSSYSNCRLKEEVVDGVQTYHNFNPTGNKPPSSCKSISGAYGTYTICREWWNIQREYLCEKSGSSYDFSDAQKRVSKIITTTNENSGNMFYQDMRLVNGSWVSSSETYGLLPVSSIPTCQNACEVKKLVDGKYQFTMKRCIDGTCPVEAGETLVKNCQCIDEFTNAATQMEVMKEAGENTECVNGEWKNGSCTGTVEIFSGDVGICRNPGVETGFHDCCEVENASHCESSEVKVAQARDDRLTYEVGERCKKEAPIGGTCLQKEKVLCVFPSILSRIIQEDGRSQLGISWGDAEHPNCRGFTPSEFQAIDFSKIDFSEYVSTIKTETQENIKQNINDEVQDFYKDLHTSRESQGTFSVILTWNPNPPKDYVIGYKIYYGTSPRHYTNVVNTGNRTEYKIIGLLCSNTYYFAATAYNAYGESGYSKEISCSGKCACKKDGKCSC